MSGLSEALSRQQARRRESKQCINGEKGGGRSALHCGHSILSLLQQGLFIEGITVREFPEASYILYSSNREVKVSGHFHEEVLVPAPRFLYETIDTYARLEAF